jgi:hypothetical protein
MQNPVKIIKQEPAARRTSRAIIFGVLFTLERVIHDVPVRTQAFVPALIRPRDRSKYMPHQGVRERARRKAGGFHWLRRSMEYGDL